jgi:hypothetical protein
MLLVHVSFVGACASADNQIFNAYAITGLVFGIIILTGVVWLRGSAKSYDKDLAARGQERGEEVGGGKLVTISNISCLVWGLYWVLVLVLRIATTSESALLQHFPHGVMHKLNFGVTNTGSSGIDTHIFDGTVIDTQVQRCVGSGCVCYGYASALYDDAISDTGYNCFAFGGALIIKFFGPARKIKMMSLRSTTAYSTTNGSPMQAFSVWANSGETSDGAVVNVTDINLWKKVLAGPIGGGDAAGKSLYHDFYFGGTEIVAKYIMIKPEPPHPSTLPGESSYPTSHPTTQPTAFPTSDPTMQPTSYPTMQPTAGPPTPSIASTSVFEAHMAQGSYTSEISWRIDNEGTTYSYSNSPQSISLAAGLHTLQMLDSYGDGWNGAQWRLKEVGGGPTVAGPFTFTYGTSATESFTVWTPPTLQNLGGNGCSGYWGYPCSKCQGDCDSDSDCVGNLKCFQRSYGEAIPGCTDPGGPSGSHCSRGSPCLSGPGDYDYCYVDPTMQPTSYPTTQPTAPTPYPTTPMTNYGLSQIELYASSAHKPGENGNPRYSEIDEDGLSFPPLPVSATSDWHCDAAGPDGAVVCA